MEKITPILQGENFMRAHVEGWGGTCVPGVETGQSLGEAARSWETLNGKLQSLDVKQEVLKDDGGFFSAVYGIMQSGCGIK